MYFKSFNKLTESTKGTDKKWHSLSLPLSLFFLCFLQTSALKQFRYFLSSLGWNLLPYG